LLVGGYHDFSRGVILQAILQKAASLRKSCRAQTIKIKRSAVRNLGFPWRVAIRLGAASLTPDCSCADHCALPVMRAAPFLAISDELEMLRAIFGTKRPPDAVGFVKRSATLANGGPRPSPRPTLRAAAFQELGRASSAASN